MNDEIAELRERLAQAVHDAFCIPLPEAARFARGYINELRGAFGGCQVYFPKHAAHTASTAEILADFNGKNHLEVCRKYTISRRTLARKLHERGGHA